MQDHAASTVIEEIGLDTSSAAGAVTTGAVRHTFMGTLESTVMATNIAKCCGVVLIGVAALLLLNYALYPLIIKCMLRMRMVRQTGKRKRDLEEGHSDEERIDIRGGPPPTSVYGRPTHGLELHGTHLRGIGHSRTGVSHEKHNVHDGEIKPNTLPHHAEEHNLLKVINHNHSQDFLRLALAWRLVSLLIMLAVLFICTYFVQITGHLLLVLQSLASLLAFTLARESVKDIFAGLRLLGGGPARCYGNLVLYKYGHEFQGTIHHIGWEQTRIVCTVNPKKMYGRKTIEFMIRNSELWSMRPIWLVE